MALSYRQNLRRKLTIKITEFIFASSLPAPRGRNISPASRSYTLTTREWGVVYLYTNIEERACDLAVYIIENRATVRSAATQFGISKSTVHKDLTERLPRLDPALYKQVRQLLDINKAERHIRGGMATRRKYKGE